MKKKRTQSRNIPHHRYEKEKPTLEILCRRLLFDYEYNGRAYCGYGEKQQKEYDFPVKKVCIYKSTSKDYQGGYRCMLMDKQR